MRTNQIKASLLLCWLLISLNLVASPRFGNLETMNVAEGLNNSTIYNIIRDQRGFVWLSTDMGLSRYDGFHFRNFPFADAVQTVQPSAIHAISKIYLDSDGLLYLQLLKGGFACFDNIKEKFLPVEFNRSMEHEKINSLYIVDKHVLYIATNSGLYTAEVKRTEKDKKDMIQVMLSDAPLLKGRISHLCSDGQGNLFFVQNQRAVVHYSMGTRQTNRINDLVNKDSPVSCLYASGDYLWICQKWETPVCYDFKRGNSRVLPDISDASGLHFAETYVTGIANVDNSNYYISTWDGLFSLKFASGNPIEAPVTIDHITQKERVGPHEIETKMTSLLWDNLQKTLWVGTFGGGAIKVSFNENVYSRLSQQINADFNGIEEDAKGYVWLATQRKGLWKSTTNTLSATTLFTPWTKGGISASASYQMYKDQNGGIWLGDEQAGIIYIDPLTEETRRYQLTPTGTKNFSGNSRQLYLDSRGRLWVVTTQGIVLFNPETASSELVFKPNGEIKELLSIAEDKEGDIWLGTDAGLKRIEMKSGAVRLVGNYEQQAGASPDAVSSIYVNSYNQIFASYQGKVIRIDGRDKNKVEAVFTLATDLNSGHIFCMIDDNNGNTWIGSNSGIMTIRNDRTFFYDYSSIGYCSAVCRLRDGRLLWADSWGLAFLDPLMVKDHKSQKKLLLSDLWVNGKSVAVGEEINGRVILSSTPDYQDEFVFSVANKELAFYFSDLQYGMMQRKLAYRLLPDEAWTVGSLEDGVHYNNLASGKYTFQVKLVYPDATEGETLEIPIVVKDYWWCTIWAFIIYILLFVGLCIAVYYYLLQKEKKKLQYAHKEASLSEELDMVKLQHQQEKEFDEVRGIVFTRLMQEMRMPLSMITSPLRELLQEKELSKGLSTKVLLAYRNSIGMKNACEQLLNVYSFAPSKSRVELASYSIVKVLDAFVYSMNEFFSVHPIQLQYDKTVSRELQVWIAKKDIELVLQNMLYNAFIHIQYSGVIALKVQETEEEDGVRYCSIAVMDNGKCAVKTIEELSTDREKLLQISYSEVELGYSVMERIMKQHHGTISLKNLNGEGTRIQIKWPIDKSAFEADENIVFIESELQEEVILPEGGALIKMIEEKEEEEVEEEEEVNLTEVGESDTVTAPSERKKKTLLVVEDHSDIRLYLKTLFYKDYNVVMAANGEEGVKMAHQELPDLILCDVMMPVKDGFECCKEIKEGLDTCHIPIIMLTAKVEEDDIIKGLEIGADDYILKPFVPQILKVKIKNLIEGRVNLKKMYTKLLVTPVEESLAETPDVETKDAGINDPFIRIVVKIVEENIQEPDFNVKKLASDLNMSQPTLYRRVKQCTDFTIIELIRSVRMKKAAVLLLKKQYSVQEVAEMVGYNDIPTFRKHFVDTYGSTPSTYADSIVC